MFDTLIFIFIFIYFTHRLLGYFGSGFSTYLTGEKRPLSFRYLFGDVLDALILCSLFYFIVMHFVDLHTDSIDFYNLGAISFGLLTTFCYINYLRKILLFSWSNINKEELFLENFSIDDEKYTIYSVPYILEKVLFIPHKKIILVGHQLNLFVPINHLKLLCQGEVLFFNRVKFIKVFLFFFFLLYFLLFLFLFKKYIPYNIYAFNLCLYFLILIYYLLNNKLYIYMISKIDLHISRTNPTDYNEALNKYRSYLFFNMHLHKYNRLQKNITVRILNLSK